MSRKLLGTPGSSVVIALGWDMLPVIRWARITVDMVLELLVSDMRSEEVTKDYKHIHKEMFVQHYSMSLRFLVEMR